MNKTICLLVFIFLNGIAVAQNPGERLFLNHHHFMNLQDLRSPETKTKVTMPIGYGETGDFFFPPQVIARDTIDDLEGDISIVTLGIQYQQKIQDWIAFYLGVEVATRVGEGASALLSQGFNTVIGFETGALVRLIQRDKIMLSLSYEVKSFQGNFVDVKGFVEDIVGGVKPRLVKKVPAMTTGGGLHFAWGVSPTFGFRSEVTYSYGETFTRGPSSSRYKLSSYLEADLNPTVKVPIGFTLGYVVTNEPEIVYVDDRTANAVEFKIAYTGRPDFDIGIEVSNLRLPLENLDQRPSLESIGLVMSYFFN